MISSSILSAYHNHVIIISESSVPFSVAGIIRECQQMRPDSCSAWLSYPRPDAFSLIPCLTNSLDCVLN